MRFPQLVLRLLIVLQISCYALITPDDFDDNVFTPASDLTVDDNQFAATSSLDQNTVLYLNIFVNDNFQSAQSTDLFASNAGCDVDMTNNLQLVAKRRQTCTNEMTSGNDDEINSKLQALIELLKPD